MSQETTFLSEGNIQVTNARFVAGDQTYAISGIVGVRMEVRPAKILGPLLLFLVGILSAILNLVIGLVIIVVACAWGFSQRKQYTAVIETAGASKSAFTSFDKNLVKNIVDSINKAIIYRESHNQMEATPPQNSSSQTSEGRWKI